MQSGEYDSLLTSRNLHFGDLYMIFDGFWLEPLLVRMDCKLQIKEHVIPTNQETFTIIFETINSQLSYWEF